MSRSASHSRTQVYFSLKHRIFQQTGCRIKSLTLRDDNSFAHSCRVGKTSCHALWQKTACVSTLWWRLLDARLGVLWLWISAKISVTSYKNKQNYLIVVYTVHALGGGYSYPNCVSMYEFSAGWVHQVDMNPLKITFFIHNNHHLTTLHLDQKLPKHSTKTI